MRSLDFNTSPKPTIGVEIELALVDIETMALKSVNQPILDSLPENLADRVKPELMQCYVELNTGICRNVSEAEADLQTTLGALSSAADRENAALYWSATHPFSKWKDQTVTDNDRYRGLVSQLQDTARQLVTFGLHVHIGVDTGDKAVMICDRILRFLPVLLAISSNSPFWEGRNTGLASWRSKVMEGLPTAGLPPLMRNWSEYVWLVNHLIDTGFLESIREIWWDVRPHHGFGTVEVRICDIPGTLQDTLSIVAFIQCLVQYLSDQIEEGTYQHDCHPMLVRQNKWHAARYGLEASLVDSETHELRPVREVVTEMIGKLGPVSQDLGCQEYLVCLIDQARQKSWAHRQVDLLEKTGDPAAVVRQGIEASSIGASSPS